LRVFGPKGQKVTGGWKSQCNEELHNVYSKPNIIRILGHVAGMQMQGDKK
jgi:hypothetical protein